MIGHIANGQFRIVHKATEPVIASRVDDIGETKPFLGKASLEGSATGTGIAHNAIDADASVSETVEDITAEDFDFAPPEGSKELSIDDLAAQNLLIEE